MSREKPIDEKHELSESIYMSGHGLDRKDSDDIAEQLYHEGYRKQSNDVPDTNVGCKFCENDSLLDDLVCYIPTDDGASIDPPVRYCPFCGSKMKGV